MTGRKKFVRKLERISGPELIKAVGRVLFVGADMIKAEAQHRIVRGSVTGSSHRASSPGTAPHNDTGHLKNNIETYMPGPLVAEVRSEAEYAAIHEFGGTINHPGGTPFFMKGGVPVFVSNKGFGAYHHLPKTKPHKIRMPSRPYMRPARDAKKEDIEKLLVQNLNRLVNDASK